MATNNPIAIGSGNKFHSQLLDQGEPSFGRMEVNYNSEIARDANLTNWSRNSDTNISTWRHTYDRTILVSGAPGGLTGAYVFRHTGRVLSFAAVGSAWVGDADVADRLTELKDASGIMTGWRYTVGADGSQEGYDASGRLMEIAQITGARQTLGYDLAVADGGDGNPDTLDAVTDDMGHQRRFAHDASGRLIRMIAPSGTSFTFEYDTQSDLVAIAHSDGSRRTFHYNETINTGGKNLPHVLTGITDEAGVRFATYQYNSTGQAINEWHAGEVDKNELAYSGASTIVTDPLGTQRTYKFTTVQGVIKSTGVSQPGGSGCNASSSALTYDANANIASRIDFSGHKTCYRYDLTRNLETKRIEGLASSAACTTVLATPPAPTAANPVRTINTAWHPDWRLEAQRAEPKKITTWVYNGQPDPTAGGATASCAPTDALLPDGKPIAVVCKKIEQATTDTTGSTGFAATATGTPRVWAWTYTRYGQVLTADGPRTDVNDVTTYTYYDATDADMGRRGNLATMTDALGRVTEFTAYDPNGRLLTFIDPNGVYTDFSYDLRGRLTSKKVGDETTRYSYDAVGQLTQVTLPDGSGLTYTYDPAHRLTAIADSLGNRIQYTLDAAGNRTKEEVFDPEGTLAKTRSQVFDALGRLYKVIGAQNQTTVYAYDADGNRTKQTDPLNGATASAYDALERLIQVTDPASGIAKLGYDGQDQIAQATDPRNLATTYTTDGLANTTRQVSPDSGTTNLTQDEAGNLLTRTDARGKTAQFQYDALNRPTQATYSDGQATRYVWDLGTHGIGRLSRIDELANGQVVSSLAYGYDAQGRIVQQTQSLGSLAFGSAYAYTDGRLGSLTLPSGRVLTYTRNPAGQVSALALDNVPLVTAITYTATGSLKGWTDPAGLVQARSFDLDGRLTAYTAGGQTWSLAYDSAGRLTGVTDSANALMAVSYGYDALDRLTSAVLPNTSYGYSYDANGNRTARSFSGTPQAITVAATSNRTLSLASTPPVAYAYDASGNRTSDALASYGYDARGRLVQATTAAGTTQYQLNALNQRIRKSGPNGETIFLYDLQGHLIGEANGQGSITREYVWLDDTPLAILDGAPGQTAIYAIHADHLNTPRAVTNAAGTVVWRNSPVSEPFGLTPVEQDPDGDGTRFVMNLRFPGQYFDAETLLANNWHRAYDAQGGFYSQSDPIGLAGGQWSTYSYVNGQPTRFTDPTGLLVGIDDLVIVGTGLLVGAAMSTPGGQKALGDAIGGATKAVKDFCQPDCTEIQRKIDRAIAELRVRYIAMTADKEGTFWNNIFGRLGWYNHQEKYREWQRNLARNVAQARSLNCPYNPEADEWLSRVPPSSPAY